MLKLSKRDERHIDLHEPIAKRRAKNHRAAVVEAAFRARLSGSLIQAYGHENI
jgi:hypothetical protein